MFLIICIVVASLLLVALAIFIWWKVELKREARKGLAKYQSLINSWLEKVEETSDDSQLSRLQHQRPTTDEAFVNRGLSYETERKLRKAIRPQANKMWRSARCCHAQQKVEAAKKRLENQESRKAYAQSQGAKSVMDKLIALFELLSLRPEELTDIGLSHARIRFQIMQIYLPALRQAREGDRRAFLELRAFFGASKAYHLRKPINGRPEDWAELVVRYLKNPDLTDFKEGLRYDHKLPQPGELRLRAAAVINSESLVGCQEVLAYCNCYNKYRSEVGDRLLAKLATLVVRLQADAWAQESNAALYG